MVLSAAMPVGFVSVTSIERARTFYVERLGLVVVEESPFALVVETGPIQLRLTPVERFTAVDGTAFGWVVDDIDTVMDRLRDRGVPPLRFAGFDQDARGVWQSPSSARVAWFSDLDGNTLSVTQQ